MSAVDHSQRSTSSPILYVLSKHYWSPLQGAISLRSPCGLSPFWLLTIFSWGMLSLAWFEVGFPLLIRLRLLLKCALWAWGPSISPVCALQCSGSCKDWILIPARSITSSGMWCHQISVSSAVNWGTLCLPCLLCRVVVTVSIWWRNQVREWVWKCVENYKRHLIIITDIHCVCTMCQTLHLALLVPYLLILTTGHKVDAVGPLLLQMRRLT